MRNIATVLLVLAAIIGMAGPVLGASAGSSASVYTDWLYTAQSTGAWANNGVDYASAGSSGDAIIIGDTGSGSGAAASDGGEYAIAVTSGYSNGLFVDTESHADSAEYDTSGYTDAGAASTASGDDVWVNSGGYGQNWALPFTSGAWASASADGIWGDVDSSAGAEAYR